MIQWLNRFDTPLPDHECDIMFKFPAGDMKLGKWIPKTQITDLGEGFIGTFTTKIGDMQKDFYVWDVPDENDRAPLIEYVLAKPHKLRKLG